MDLEALPLSYGVQSQTSDSDPKFFASELDKNIRNDGSFVWLVDFFLPIY